MSIPSPRRAAVTDALQRQIDALRDAAPTLPGSVGGPVWAQVDPPEGYAVGWFVGQSALPSVLWWAVEGGTGIVSVYHSGSWQAYASLDSATKASYEPRFGTVRWFGVVREITTSIDELPVAIVVVEGTDTALTDTVTTLPLDVDGVLGHIIVQDSKTVYPPPRLDMDRQRLNGLLDVDGYQHEPAGSRPATGALFMYDRTLIDNAGAWTPLAPPASAGQLWAWTASGWVATPAPTTSGQLLAWNGSAWALATTATPGAHAASHGFGGSDALTLAQSQITNLTTDLAGKEAAGTAASAVATHAALTSGVHGISAFGANLIDDANASAARTTLGLGTAATTDSTAYEAAGAVATHAALTSGVHGISAFGANLIDDANASAARTTLGLGTAATTNSTAYEAAGAVATHNSGASGVHGITAFGSTLINKFDAAAWFAHFLPQGWPQWSTYVSGRLLQYDTTAGIHKESQISSTIAGNVLTFEGTLTGARACKVPDTPSILPPRGTVEGQGLLWDNTNALWVAQILAAAPDKIGALTDVGTGTLTRPAGAKHLVMILQGAGGSGARFSSTSPAAICGGSPGGTLFVVHRSAGGNATVTAGSGGAGKGTNGDGNNGGSTTVVVDGVTYTAGGGLGGPTAYSSSANPAAVTLSSSADAGIQIPLGRQHGSIGIVVPLPLTTYTISGTTFHARSTLQVAENKPGGATLPAIGSGYGQGSAGSESASSAGGDGRVWYAWVT